MFGINEMREGGFDPLVPDCRRPEKLGPIATIPVLGGLHHQYGREAQDLPRGAAPWSPRLIVIGNVLLQNATQLRFFETMAVHFSPCASRLVKNYRAASQRCPRIPVRGLDRFPSDGIPPFKYAVTATAVDIGRGEVMKALVVTPGVLVIDELGEADGPFTAI
jgi:hypothetical protein